MADAPVLSPTTVDAARRRSASIGLGSTRDRAIIVGAGMGGLSCAISLASRGLQVTVVESGPVTGGKMTPVMVDGHAIDSGPTVFTMRWVFDQLFAQAGACFETAVPCRALSVLARHAWRDHGPTLDLLADRRHALDAVAHFSGPDEARRFAAFCSEAARLYRHLEGPYIRSERPTMGSLVRDLGPGGLVSLMGLGPFSSLWRTLGRRFTDPRLRQLFARYATYCGSSPWQAPATLMLIAQVELDGVWSVEGGMGRLAGAMTDLAQALGVEVLTSTAVGQILVEGGRAAGVQLTDGQVMRADTVVFNGDVQALTRGSVLGVERDVDRVPAHHRSLSALTWSMVAPTSGFDLARHNVFFDRDYQSEFGDIFGQGRLPRHPTVYVCAQDRLNGVADEGGPALGQPERMLVLVNAPAMGDRGKEQDPHAVREIDTCETATYGLLQACGLNMERTPSRERRTSPWAFEARFPATGGSLYGPATHGWMSSFRRASSATRLPGLFLAGGSAHPGPGVPMATLSGRLAAETVMARLDSTSRSARVVIAGGISMPSATMDSTG